MALKKIVRLNVSAREYTVGFENYVRTRLTPITINGESRPPRPDSVRKILSGERESKRLVLDIFMNGTDLMIHPSVCAKVKTVFEHWKKHGTLPASYGDWKKHGTRRKA